jgi:hypothetical protein
MLGYWSSMFGDTFGLPEGDGNAGEGRSNDTPVVPPTVTADEFTFLVQILFGNP